MKVMACAGNYVDNYISRLINQRWWWLTFKIIFKKMLKETGSKEILLINRMYIKRECLWIQMSMVNLNKRECHRQSNIIEAVVFSWVIFFFKAIVKFIWCKLAIMQMGREVAFQEALWSRSEKKHRKNNLLIIHFCTSKGVSKRASGWVRAA